MDVRAWQPERKWSLVTANLFSYLLIEVTRRSRNRSRAAGASSFSGILRPGSRILAALEKRRLSVERVIRKGQMDRGRGVARLNGTSRALAPDLRGERAGALAIPAESPRGLESKVEVTWTFGGDAKAPATPPPVIAHTAAGLQFSTSSQIPTSSAAAFFGSLPFSGLPPPLRRKTCFPVFSHFARMKPLIDGNSSRIHLALLILLARSSAPLGADIGWRSFPAQESARIAP